LHVKDLHASNMSTTRVVWQMVNCKLQRKDGEGLHGALALRGPFSLIDVRNFSLPM